MLHLPLPLTGLSLRHSWSREPNSVRGDVQWLVIPLRVGTHRIQLQGEPQLACLQRKHVPSRTFLSKRPQAQRRTRWSYPASQIEEVETALSLPPSVPVPEALFADNSLTIRHDASGTALRINAVDALRSWHSRQSRIATDAGSLVCATSFDWAYENEYDGLVVRGPDAATVPFEDSPCGLPMELLRLREDIVWSCHLSLYEDDLHDMGVSIWTLCCACALLSRPPPPLLPQRCCMHCTSVGAMPIAVDPCFPVASASVPVAGVRVHRQSARDAQLLLRVAGDLCPH